MLVDIRAASPSDQTFLESMFVEAVLWDPRMGRQSLARLLQVPELRPYFIDWGRRPGDLALIASREGERHGAAWYRFFSADAPGYGFVDESIPELGIAVVLESRGGSIGTALLTQLMEAARSRGCGGLSLSVSRANPARRLYERCGFSKVGESGASWTMLAPFS